jgi:hypothetical protein
MACARGLGLGAGAILLQFKIDPGSSGDPMARRKVTCIAAPPGAKLEVVGS